MLKRKQNTIRLCMILAVTLSIALAPASTMPAQADEPQSTLACTEGEQSSNARYQICMPDPWNGTLIVWSHGYVAPNQPLAIRNTFGSVSLPETYQSLGYAFATTSFSKNGLAIRQGVDDLLDLVTIFNTQHTTPTRILLHGVSLGSLSAALAIEENPTVFDGALAMCGPYGDFQAQSDYFVDTRVLFDYFFPALIAGTPVNIPQTVIDDWPNISSNVIVPTLANPANSSQVNQLLSTSQVAFDTNVLTTTIEALSTVLWFNVQGTNDGVATLGGQSFDNRNRTYTGSLDDALLNQNVTRFAPSQTARDEISQRYQTSGQLQTPLVTMHTTLDPVVPYAQATAYQAKIDAAGRSAFHVHQAFERYGHCVFTAEEIFGALTVLNQMVDNAGNIDTTRKLYLPVVAASME